jgi:hypothetical protein
VCFSTGHGELGADEPGARGLGELKHRLERNNAEIQIVDVTSPDAKSAPWKGCTLVVVASPQVPWTAAEVKPLVSFVEGGGNALLFLNPVVDSEKNRAVPSGLEPVAALGGIELHNDVIFERDKSVRAPGTVGETFLGQAAPHPITQALVENRAPNARMLFQLAQSLGKNPNSSVQPAVLIHTSKDAFGMVDFLSWTAEMGTPEKRPGDRDGPLAVAMAAELPKPQGSSDAHGPRIIVVGSRSVTLGASWQEPALRGGAFFVESAISWLTSKPQIVDIPQKPPVMAGLRLTDESLNQVSNYVVYYIPLAGALVGASVFLRRRSTERRKDSIGRTRKK